MRIVVDLPAPFGPRNPVTVPAGPTVKVRSSTANVSPYRFVKPSISIMCVSLSPWQELGRVAYG